MKFIPSGALVEHGFNVVVVTFFVVVVARYFWLPYCTYCGDIVNTIMFNAITVNIIINTIRRRPWGIVRRTRTCKE